MRRPQAREARVKPAGRRPLVKSGQRAMNARIRRTTSPGSSCASQCVASGSRQTVRSSTSSSRPWSKATGSAVSASPQITRVGTRTRKSSGRRRSAAGPGSVRRRRIQRRRPVIVDSAGESAVPDLVVAGRALGRVPARFRPIHLQEEVVEPAIAIPRERILRAWRAQPVHVGAGLLLHGVSTRARARTESGAENSARSACSIRSGFAIAHCHATAPPQSCATTIARSSPKCATRRSRSPTISRAR